MPSIGGFLSVWYKTHLHEDFQQSGVEFERRVQRILRHIYPDFVDPDPNGREGDSGCDGMAENGSVIFACYGSEGRGSEQSYLKRKVKSDFDRALSEWPGMTKWRFVTNSKVSANFLRDTWTPMCSGHGEGSDRPVEMRLIGEEYLWDLMRSSLDRREFDNIYPGVPDYDDFELSDFIEVVEDIISGQPAPIDDLSHIEEVSPAKMDYNEIPELRRLELSLGRKNSWVIERYFCETDNVEQAQELASRLRAIYQKARSTIDDPSEIMTYMYTKIGGPRYSSIGRQREATVHAIAAYFFDSCDIFEAVPDGWGELGGDEK